MDGKFEALKALAKEAVLIPQEQMEAVGAKKRRLFIGIPKESSLQEHRVALIPGAVSLLVNNGHRVVVESEAGKKVAYSDRDYSDAGAQIVYSTKEVYQAEMILKVAPPSNEEIAMMRQGQVLFSALQLSVQPKDALKKLMDKGVTAVAWEHIKDESQIYPVVRAMGEIAGNMAIQIAAENLSNPASGSSQLFGGISGVPPTEVVILGAGTVGEFATRAALGLGATVKVFDNSIYRLRRLQNDLGVRLYTSIIQPDTLADALRQADVAIGALRSPYGRTPCVVTEAMVRNMKNGSVIVDISIDQGGCFETSEVMSHDNPVFTKFGVTHYGVPNIASRVSKTASHALSNIFAPIVLNMADSGGVVEYIKRDVGFRNGIYMYRGHLTNKVLGEAFSLPHQDLDLLLPALT